MRRVSLQQIGVCTILGLSLAFFVFLPTAQAQHIKNVLPAASMSPLWFDLEPGPFRVGFQVLYRTDPTRSYDSAGENASAPPKGRPIRIMVWYPAEKLSGKPKDVVPMRFGDYVNVETTDARFADFNRMLRERDQRATDRQFSGPDAAALAKKVMQTPVAAYLNAPAAEGRFPVIVHSTGRNNFQQESTVLWEYLASHGYVVASVPQLGFSPEKARLNFALPDIKLQQQDIEFALNEISKFPNADPRRAVAMGHSSGGVVSLLVAAHNPNVAAVVSLDGELTFKDGIAIIESAGLNRAQFRAHILAMYRATDKDPIDYSLLNSLVRVDRYYLSFVKSTHFDFQNWPLYSVLTNTEEARAAQDRPAAIGRDNYLMACRSVRQFLDAKVKRRDSAKPWFRSVSGNHIRGDRRLVNFGFQKG